MNEPLDHKLITVAAYGLVCPSQMGFSSKHMQSLSRNICSVHGFLSFTVTTVHDI